MMHSDAVNLAWDLADELAPTLGAESRVALYAALGAGESHVVIEGILKGFRSRPTTLNEELVRRVHAWADVYLQHHCPTLTQTELCQIVGEPPAPPCITPPTSVCPHFGQRNKRLGIRARIRSTYRAR